MKKYIFAGWLMVCAGCGGESLTSGANPLETYDQDRLWVLISAVGIGAGGDGCARYYRDPDNPQWKTINRGDLSKVCPEVMVKIAAYLEHNGVAGVTPAHLQRPAFWDQMQAKYEAIQQCQEQLGGDWFNPPPDPENPKPKRADFPNHEAYRAAEQEYVQRRKKQAEEWRRARTACDPYQVAQRRAQGEERRKPSLEGLGISLPEGVDFRRGGI